ncbi:MAG: hypothetical protein R3F34_02275 [Planctomycetota bacterium]
MTPIRTRGFVAVALFAGAAILVALLLLTLLAPGTAPRELRPSASTDLAVDSAPVRVDLGTTAPNDAGSGDARRTAAAPGTSTATTFAVARVLRAGAPADDADVEFHPVAGGEVLLARSDADGYVRVDEGLRHLLATEGPWLVLVGCRGACNRRLAPLPFDGATPVVVEIVPTAFALYVPRRSDGTPLGRWDGLGAPPGVTYSARSAGHAVDTELLERVRREGVDDLERRLLELAGLPRDFDLERGTVFVHGDEDEREACVLASFAVGEPDTRRASFHFWLAPLTRGPFVVEYTLEVLDARLGEIEVAVHGAPGDVVGARLELACVQGGPEDAAYGDQVRELEDEVLLGAVDLRLALPRGRWRARLVSDEPSWRSDEVVVDVGEADVPRVEFTLPVFATVRVEIDGLGAAFDERLDAGASIAVHWYDLAQRGVSDGTFDVDRERLLHRLREGRYVFLAEAGGRALWLTPDGRAPECAYDDPVGVRSTARFLRELALGVDLAVLGEERVSALARLLDELPVDVRPGADVAVRPVPEPSGR